VLIALMLGSTFFRTIPYTRSEAWTSLIGDERRDDEVVERQS